jgi:hypothetical protein
VKSVQPLFTFGPFNRNLHNKNLIIIGKMVSANGLKCDKEDRESDKQISKTLSISMGLALWAFEFQFLLLKTMFKTWRLVCVL